MADSPHAMVLAARISLQNEALLPAGRVTISSVLMSVGGDAD
jgi:hypothetical protein